MPGRNLEVLFKSAMTDLLPPTVISRPKTGFMLPIRKWMVDDFQLILGDLLAPRKLEAQGIFDPSAVRQENKSNQADHAYLLYALMTFQIWQARYT